MTPDAPSPLHRALRWSLPGAALLSAPFGFLIWERVWRIIGGPALSSGFWPMFWGICFLGFVSLAASTKAIHCCLTCGEPPGMRSVLVVLFNLLVIFAVVVLAIVLVGLFSDGYLP